MNNMKCITLTVLAIALLSLHALAGSLNPPGVPSAGSNMPTTAAIFQQLSSGTQASSGGAFHEPTAGPTVGTGRALAEIMGKLPAVDGSNGAATSDVLSGKTFWGLSAGAWGNQTGTMTNKSNTSFTPGTADQTIPAGFYDGTGKVYGDINLDPSKIQKGIIIFNVVGTKPLPWGCQSLDGTLWWDHQQCVMDCSSEISEIIECVNNICDVIRGRMAHNLDHVISIITPALVSYCNR